MLEKYGEQKKCINCGTRHDYKRNKGYREGTNRILMRNKAIKIWGTKKCRNCETRHDYKRNKGYGEGTNRILMRDKAVKIWGTKKC
jgi:hypothetical protein